MISFREIADTIDGFDAEASDLLARRKEYWSEIREEILPRDIKPLKAAIKARRERRTDLDAAEAHDQRVAEILAEIETDENPSDRIRARAELPPHDPDTGELIDDPLASMRARSKARLSEAMSDHKKLTQHAADLGLISSEAAQENASLADAVADKLGAGVILDIPACVARCVRAEATE